MTTDAILALIDARLSKVPNSDAAEQVALLLNELRERVFEDGMAAQAILERRGRDQFIAEKKKEQAVYIAERDKHIQELSAQLCAIRAAAGMQVGTIAEVCQQIEAMREDAAAWNSIDDI